METLPGIDVVRGRTDDVWGAELLALWERHGALTAEQGRERLPEVVCVVRDEDGAVAGACSVFDASVALLGGRHLFVMRIFLPGAAAARLPALIEATYGALAAEYDGAPGSAVGLCALLDAQQRARRPEAEWRDGEMRMIYAGYTGDGRQARVAYFREAAIGPGQVIAGYESAPLAEGYRIMPFAEQDVVTSDDVVELWLREGVLPEAEARRRIGELHLLGVDDRDRPVGVTTTYLEHNAQLGMNLWYYRAFVSADHRQSSLAVWLAVRGRELLSERFVSGADTRAAGAIYEVENEGLKRYFPQAHWLPTDFIFIGENERGDHVRVHYFPGAVAPDPQGSTYELVTS